MNQIENLIYSKYLKKKNNNHKKSYTIYFLGKKYVILFNKIKYII